MGFIGVIRCTPGTVAFTGEVIEEGVFLVVKTAPFTTNGAAIVRKKSNH
jgi:hypothetical protein